MSDFSPCRLCGEPYTEPRWEVDGYGIHQCRSCDLLFVTNVPDAKSLAAHYGNDYLARAAPYAGRIDSPNSASRLNARARVRAIRAEVSGGCLLDVGCAGGEFLIEAFPYFDVRGVEVTEESAARARKRGLSISVAADLSELVAEGRRFDVITLWDVIEHLPDPLGVLRQARALLRPGGALYMTTGDAASFVARISGKRWHLLTPPLHLFFFTPSSIGWMLERAGFSSPKISYPSQKALLGFAAFKLADRAPSPSTRALRRLIDRLPIRHWAFGVNLWDMMLVAARGTEASREPESAAAAVGVELLSGPPPPCGRGAGELPSSQASGVPARWAEEHE
ncbi:MAG: hypothetical protein CL908_16000 [Deltaproteobacteria bacterium]|nr:hypothetical protein [Deltaproteobacteria bacterium]